jgi:hypothetical protein
MIEAQDEIGVTIEQDLHATLAASRQQINTNIIAKIITQQTPKFCLIP